MVAPSHLVLVKLAFGVHLELLQQVLQLPVRPALNLAQQVSIVRKEHLHLQYALTLVLMHQLVLHQELVAQPAKLVNIVLKVVQLPLAVQRVTIVKQVQENQHLVLRRHILM